MVDSLKVPKVVCLIILINDYSWDLTNINENLQSMGKMSREYMLITANNIFDLDCGCFQLFKSFCGLWIGFNDQTQYKREFDGVLALIL